MKTIEEVITSVVDEVQGIKLMDLIVRLRDEHSEKYMGVNIFKVIDDMELQGKLVIIRYFLPTMEYRLKEFIFPGGTKIEK